MKNMDAFLIAHVELSKARFHQDEDIGFEIRNEIDAWRKMEIHFRQQIRNPRKRVKKGKQDLNPYIYSFRERMDLT